MAKNVKVDRGIQLDITFTTNRETLIKIKKDEDIRKQLCVRTDRHTCSPFLGKVSAIGNKADNEPSSTGPTLSNFNANFNLLKNLKRKNEESDRQTDR